MTTRSTIHTPIRQALKASSSLQNKVKDGIRALEKGHRKHLRKNICNAFGDSLDIDTALQPDHPQESRWDYLLGHSQSKKVIAMEVHSAKSDQVSTVIKKKKAAQDQLKLHLKDGMQPKKWFWVASGKVAFLTMERATLRLNQAGIEFVSKQLTQEHCLPTP